MEKLITKWFNEGLIDSVLTAKLLEDVKKEKERLHKTKINIAIYTVAVILIGLGVITFISANDWILELLNSSLFLKIFLMFILTISSLFGGYQLAYEKKNFPKLGNALIVLSTLLIGGTYAIIGQGYNINANNSLLMFLWLLSIVPVAYLFKNHTINILSIILLILGIIFRYNELSLDNGLIWTIFIPVLCGLILYSIGNIPFILEKYNDFSLSYKIAGAFPIFITLLILTCSVEHSYHITSHYYIVPLVTLIILNLFNIVHQKNKTTLLKIETTAIIIISSFLLLLLILKSVSAGLVMTVANIMIIAMIAFGFYYGYKFENSKIIGVTNQIITIYLAVNYCRWGWSFMDKSLFFILGGFLLLTLGMFLEKRRKEIINKGN